jgi:hypothetical protein
MKSGAVLGMSILSKVGAECRTQILRTALFKVLTQHKEPVNFLIMDSCDSFERRGDT